jgi:hypothetical protein
MHKRVLVLTISALIFAYGPVAAIAQDRMPPQDQQHTQHHPAGQEGAGTMGPGGTMACGIMGQGGMMGPGAMGRRGMMGGGMMGGGAMGPPMMMRMIFALMDSDGEGTIELPNFRLLTSEFQVHGQQQRWPAYSGRDASVHAGDQELGHGAVSLVLAPHFSGGSTASAVARGFWTGGQTGERRMHAGDQRGHGGRSNQPVEPCGAFLCKPLVGVGI